MITATGQDVYLSDDKFEIGRNFGTKIWNAALYMQMHTKDAKVEPFLFNRAQKYIHERLEAQRAACGRVRALILKGRQQGCSTLIG